MANKYYLAQIDEQDGEYSHKRTIMLCIEESADCPANPMAALDSLAADWYGGERDRTETGYIYGDVHVSAGKFAEIPEDTWRAISAVHIINTHHFAAGIA